MSEIRIGRFLSRDIDSVSVRSGRSASMAQRVVYVTDIEGRPTAEVCRVSFPSNVARTESIKKLTNVMRCLDAGMSQLNAE